MALRIIDYAELWFNSVLEMFHIVPTSIAELSPAPLCFHCTLHAFLL